MSDRGALHTVPRSSHAPLRGAVPIAPVHPAEYFEVNLILRRRADGPPLPSAALLGAQPPRRRQLLSREEFEARHGASPQDVQIVHRFAVANRLDVTRTSLARRTVTVAGTAAQFAKAFATSFSHYVYAGGSYRSHCGPIRVPENLSSIVTAVIGFDERPVAFSAATPRHTQWSIGQVARAQMSAATAADQFFREQQRHLNEACIRMLADDPSLGKLADDYQRWTGLASNPATPRALVTQAWIQNVLSSAWNARQALSKANAAYLAKLIDIAIEAQRLAVLAALDELDIKIPPGVARLYEFPADTDGSGQCVGIIELGGGYRRQDLEAYFAFVGVPMPVISDVSVSGGINLPGIYEPFDGEVCLDIEIIGGIAPGARLVCYFAPLTAKGFIEAVHTAIHDRENTPSVISASWDLSEAFWLESPMHIEAFEEVLQEAAVLGVTLCCAAGDYGSSSEFLDGRAWVDYPASSPHVLGCGGTTLYSRGDRVIAEIVWNTERTFLQATGGGVSQVFPLPSWQDSADVPESVNPGGGRGRGVPDVAANADPTTGYLVQVNGGSTVICGTSAAAPLWSALLARINQSLGRPVGYINPFLYESVRHTEAFRDILIVGNGAYAARRGWDACTGWGTPNGAKLRDALAADV
jgi:subtilase family serine protease